MPWFVLQAIRDKLKSDAAILAALAAAGQAEPKFFIGAKAKPTAQEFPYFAVAPLRGSRPQNDMGEITQNVSVMFGILDDRVADGESLGLKLICELEELVLAAMGQYPIYPFPTGQTSPRVYWLGEATTVSDSGVQHPFYEAEMIFDVTVNP